MRLPKRWNRVVLLAAAPFTLLLSTTAQVFAWPQSLSEKATNTNVQAMAMSPDGSLLAVAGSAELDAPKGTVCQVQLWSLTENKLVHSLKGRDTNVFSVAFSRDGKSLASAENTNVQLWDVESGKHKKTLNLTSRGHADTYPQVSFSPDGKTLIGSYWQGIKMWEADTGRYLRVIPTCSEAHAVSPDGKIVASVGGTDVDIIDFSSGRTIRSIKGDSYWKAVTFSPDGSTLARGSDTWGTAPHIELWDMATYTLVRTFKGPEKRVDTLAFTPDGKGIAAGGGTRVSLWDIETRQLVQFHIGQNDKINSLIFSSDGSKAITGSWTGPVRLTEIE